MKTPSTPRSPTTGYAPSPQSADGRFRNIHPRPANAPRPGAGLMWTLLFNKPADSQPRMPLPVQSLTRAMLDAAPERSLYRLGHSTLLMKLRGGWWITDPVFAERASPFSFMGPKRFHAPPIALHELPALRGVVLSHDHYDHLDRATIQALAARTDFFLSPLGVGDRLIAWGVPQAKVHQFDWWQDVQVDGLRLTATPAQHFSGRGLRDGNRTLWSSWVIEDQDSANALRIFFSGDGGYFDGFAQIGRRFGPFDLTLMETGAYDPHWPYVHMHPAQTVQAHRDLGGRWLLPIHNGTFNLALHPWWDPFERVLALGAEQGIAIATPMMGERLDLSAPHAGERWWRALVPKAARQGTAAAAQAQPR
ncbi:MBL fold metallo-hydrolase [Delftia sp. PS-11]|uniref:MBL fold metallo-hydrolase n=1 Tax=Delftia sp. PS-11 TaxID=2767222 RepID=UPI002457AB5C|nr:MBL fold metallo-hydrolase [Delftia sp. PS-11]KAJ8741682.1 MBL fold metallo-hydrolase [Delftia sp. PS-11]